MGLEDLISVQSLLENWDLWQHRIHAYSLLEVGNRKKLGEITAKFDTASKEMKGAYNVSFYILSRCNLDTVTHITVVNPRRACSARVTVLFLCVTVCVLCVCLIQHSRSQ